MALKTQLVFWAGLVLLSFAVASCDELRGPGGGEAHQTSQVTVSVRPAGSATLVNGLAGAGTAQFGTSLVVLVATGTAPLADQNALDAASVYDQALLDLTTGTVTLVMPLGVSVQLFEYTFSDVLNLAEITDGTHIGGTPHQSAPFTLATETTELTVSLPLASASVQEGFTGALDPAVWEEAGTVTSSGGVLKLVTSAAFNAAATTEEARLGDIARIRSNRNILLNSHRVAGTIAVNSFSVNDATGSTVPVRGRAQARLHYQPRNSRGDATGLTIVRLLFHGMHGGTYLIRMDAGTCTAPICSGPSGSFVGFDAAHRKFFAIPVVAPTPNIPFSLEYIGGNVFRGTVNGVSRDLDISALTTFDANDFRDVELRAESNMAFNSGDTAALTATFTNIEVGDDGTAGNEGGPIRAFSPEYVYLSNQNSGHISAYTMDPATGVIALDVLYALGGTTTPRGIKVHPTGQFLYVVLGGSNAVHGFRINPATNAITLIPGSPFAGGALPIQIAIDPEGRHLYMANQTGGSISFYAIDPATGALSEHASSPFATGTQATWVTVHQSGKFVYTTDGANNQVYALSRNTLTGELAIIAGSPFNTGAVFPAGVTVHPKGNLLYIVHNTTAQVRSYSLNTSTGAIIATLGSVNTPGGPVNLAFAGASKFAYLGAETGDRITGFEMVPDTGGMITILNLATSAGAGPEVMSTDPSGRFLFIPMGGANLFAVASIDAGTGSLTVVNQLPSSGTFPIEAAPRAILR